ncbi:hypothetical protein BS50DRAFT_677467 [Corynespora cassiicola Philippines]|uniref:Uncharacterized protein n=1 Tax=Corynespora cassiicola Philippines TaxID=1448308 RepID=A0A2T2NLA5_CORCC|nr:hypothetical protein BS50DRAFT_677467 [Corynespora cassiicola Philippines]
MPATMVTFAMAQAACSTITSGINAYLQSPPTQSFSSPSGKESLFDEDNWARVLDLQDVLCLVRPFIVATQYLDVDEIQAASQSSIRGLGRRLGSTAPPPYTSSNIPSDPEEYLSTQAYRISQLTTHFIEKLRVAAAGPSNSSPRAWNLNVAAAEEFGLELLSLYCETTTTMASAPPNTFLSVALEKMRLNDTHMLNMVASHFKPVELGKEYQLRLPAEKRYLAIPEITVAQSKLGKRTLKAGGLMASTILGPVGFAATGAVLTYRHYSKKSKAAAAARKPVARGGEPGTRITFVAVEEHKDSSEKGSQNGNLMYGMLVYVMEGAGEDVNGLRDSRDQSQLAQVRIIHCDERHREQSHGRAVCVRDRVLLKEEGTGRLLGRKKLSEETWETGFDVSDDNMWVVSSTM